MDRDQVLAILRSHEPELRAAGVEHLRLFGSVARGEHSIDSDIDISVEMDRSKPWGLFALGGLQSDISEWLKAQVDLSEWQWLRPSIRERVLREAIDAF